MSWRAHPPRADPTRRLRVGGTALQILRTVAERERDDGAERVLHFRIEGRLPNGVPLTPVDVSAAQFAVERLGEVGWSCYHDETDPEPFDPRRTCFPVRYADPA